MKASTHASTPLSAMNLTHLRSDVMEDLEKVLSFGKQTKALAQSLVRF